MRKIPGDWGLALTNEKQLQTMYITKLNANTDYHNLRWANTLLERDNHAHFTK